MSYIPAAPPMTSEAQLYLSAMEQTVPVLEELHRRIEQLEKERDFHLRRIMDLEEALYRREPVSAIRAKFDEESA